MTEFLNALKELRKNSPKRNFEQSIDLIINLRDFDIKKQPVNTAVVLPFQIRESKICAFLDKENSEVDYTVKKDEIARYNPDQIKRLAQEYDFFISMASLMPAVATTFGRILGPLGKMPNPKTGGVIMDEKSIKDTIQRMKKTASLKTKDNSIKLSVGKENMPDEQIEQNAAIVYRTILDVLPNKKENIKNVMLKFTMSKPSKVKI
jgi:large subunit ribosomal protein L1